MDPEQMWSTLSLPRDAQIQEGRRLYLARWWPLDTLPWEPTCHRWLAAAQGGEESQEVCGNGLSLTAQRSCRRGMFSGAGEAQSFPQHFQVCGCPEVNSKGSVENAEHLLEAQPRPLGSDKAEKPSLQS